jgi:hypothetical protein
MKTSPLFFYFGIVTALMGCAPLPPLVGTPGGMTSIEAERNALNGFDPFPEDRSAPAIDGARPPGFEHPVSEPDRVRRKPWLPE